MIHAGARPHAASLLATDLRARVRGEVRFDRGSRHLYATDASNYRQLPIGVVVPLDVDDVVAAIQTARQHGAPVLARGGGTSLAGQCCNTAVVLDMSKYLNRVLEVNSETRRARVQPGLVLDVLRDAAEEYNLTFGPDPATHDRCTLGGMIGNNSCGVHSVMAGKTDANIEELEILTYDGLRLRVGATGDGELERIIAVGGRRGEIYAGMKALRDRYADLIRERFPRIPRRVSGYGLDQLLPENGFNVARALVGTEGTCVTVLEATVCLVHSPPARTVAVLGYQDVYTAADAVPEVMGYGPIGLEGFDDWLVNAMRAKRLHLENLKLLPEGTGWLLVEFGGQSREEANGRANKLIDGLAGRSGGPQARLFDDPKQITMLWAVRESGLGAAATVAGTHYWEGWEDSAVPPDRFGAYLRDLRTLMNRYDYGGTFYGHFGEACLHTRLNFDLKSQPGVEKFDRFINEAADLVVSYGGSLSGEHGDGQARAELLPKMYGPELVRAFGQFRAIWDPDNKMNPGKVVEPYRIDQNLRLGAGYDPIRPKTHFAFSEDNGSFANAMMRCVGVGKCRRHDGGVMCPSYMATREEMHSTRGRARLLWEMIQRPARSDDGGLDLWRSDHVKEALDLCLACKGCKSDCPVSVDMATYKAEFLSHYYAGRLRPITGYTMGLIYWWAGLASRAPRLANFVTQTPVLRSVVKRLGGVAPQRRIPVLASETFTRWFKRRTKSARTGRQVLLWPDTFNNHFHPESARAAVEVLEAAGFGVMIPTKPLCCGRPLYDYGFLTQAKFLLRQILETLRPQIEAGVPLIVLEPSCLAVFRDELLNLFPDDPLAKNLSEQSFLLSELLTRPDAPKLEASLAGTALLHVHCHQKALGSNAADATLLRNLGLMVETPDPGCCGMAGAFGFERNHYDVSIAVGERALVPAVRQANTDVLIVAGGFSCREQVEQMTGRHAVHIAEVLAEAIGHHPPPA